MVKKYKLVLVDDAEESQNDLSSQSQQLALGPGQVSEEEEMISAEMMIDTKS